MTIVYISTLLALLITKGSGHSDQQIGHGKQQRPTFYKLKCE